MFWLKKLYSSGGSKIVRLPMDWVKKTGLPKEVRISENGDALLIEAVKSKGKK